jgi:hypothetical protein
MPWRLCTKKYRNRREGLRSLAGDEHVMWKDARKKRLRGVLQPYHE